MKKTYLSRDVKNGGVETGSMYVQYVQVISANVPYTYYLQPLNSLKRYVCTSRTVSRDIDQ